ncbi:putative ribonuclease H-like domain-containing protein [Tanacetum coccineum]
MTSTKEYLSDYQEIKGGFVAFGEGKGRITGKGNIKTDKLDFDDVYYVNGLKRLGHVNFKTMNKLVKGNLVRGLPSKLFENDHSCVACQKGKQHKATYKAKLVSSISQPLQILHMDLFGPTSVLSLNHKKYCLVVTDDFKFKNKEMNDFCANKGIRREFSNARTPQQNGVAKRKNKTLIEAARTMLADSLLLVIFWAEAVNTACYVLNRFEGKADEGFLVGYSIHSKAFRVYNTRTRHVEENLHVTFLENKPNMQGEGPEWLFNLDYLTNSMNYKPVVTENRANNTTSSKEANDSAGLKTRVDAEHAKEDTTFAQPFVLLPLWPSNSLFSSKSSAENEVIDAGKKTVQELTSENDQVFLDELTRGAPISSSTKTFSVVHTLVNTADDEIPELVEINNDYNYGIFTHSSYDDKNWDFQDDMVEGAVADNNNIDTSNVFSSIPTLEFIPFIKKLKLLEELLQFKIQKVWVLVDLLYGKKAIGTKWVYKNKKDERGVVVKNKARLVTQGHRQKEGIDYDEKALYGLHQAPKAWYATLSTFLLKSGYRRGTIDKTLFINKDMKDIMLVQVKQKKDGIFLSQDKYVAEILKKFDFENVKTASTPIETQKPLVKDEEAADVDVHLYRFQVTPKTSHLNAVKRIFRYLKGQPKLGLWYPKESSFDLVAYSDSDYACANLDRKSTTGEYVAAAHYCGDSYEKKLIQVLKIHTNDNVADLLTKAFNGPRFNFLVVKHGFEVGWKL